MPAAMSRSKSAPRSRWWKFRRKRRPCRPKMRKPPPPSPISLSMTCRWSSAAPSAALSIWRRLTPEAKNFGDNNFVLGGGQSASYGTNLDGVSANTTRALTASWVAVNTPSVEAITEFTVESNGFKAEYGHAGGGMMSFASKSGTNNLHGNVYEFLRNDALDANRFFSNALNQKKAVYKQNDFGATAGGPVWIPKIYNGRNKTFFFFSYEGFRNRKGATATSATVPTPEMYNGDFSKWVDAAGRQIPIYDPATTRADSIQPHGFVTRRVSRQRDPERPLRPGCAESAQRIPERRVDADTEPPGYSRHERLRPIELSDQYGHQP